MPALLDKVKSYITTTEEIKTEADRLWEEAWSGDLSYEESKELRDKVRAMDDEAAFRELVAHMPTSGEKRVDKALKALQSAGRKFHHTSEASAHWSKVRIETLNLVNMWREELGLDPLDRLPAGRVKNSSDCVIARALSIEGHDGWRAEIGGSIIVVGRGDGKTAINQDSPTYASLLISGFDSRAEGYRDLIA